jgi:hypothetical protein
VLVRVVCSRVKECVPDLAEVCRGGDQACVGVVQAPRCDWRLVVAASKPFRRS